MIKVAESEFADGGKQVVRVCPAIDSAKCGDQVVSGLSIYSESLRSIALVPFDDGVFQFLINYPSPKDSQQQVELLNFKRVGEGNSVELSPRSP
jgi:hypothetical protein